MGTKTLIRLLIALVVVGGVAAILHFANPGGNVAEVESSTSKKKVFDDFPINEVASVEIRNAEGSVHLEKGEENWQVEERNGYPADTESIVSLLRDLWDLNIGQPVTIGRSQYGRLDLVHPEEASGDSAATILTFQNEEGNDIASLWLGKVHERADNRPSPFGGGMAMTDAGRYVKTGGSNAVFLVSETFDDIDIDPAVWLDQDFFEIQGIRTIEMRSGNEEEDWKLVRESPTGDFSFADPREGEELEQSKVSSMKSAFSNPQFEDVYTGEAKEENQPDKTTFVITTFDDFRYEVRVGEKNDLNELPLSLKVSADLPEKREEGEEESDEEKKELDEAFTRDLEEKKEKLAREKALEGHVFKVRSFLVDSISKPRSELLAEPESADGTPPGSDAEIAPGVSLPGAGGPSNQ